MMALFYLAVGFIVGLFVPSPFDAFIKGWTVNLWNSIFKKTKTKSTKSCCDK